MAMAINELCMAETSLLQFSLPSSLFSGTRLKLSLIYGVSFSFSLSSNPQIDSIHKTFFSKRQENIDL